MCCREEHRQAVYVPKTTGRRDGALDSPRRRKCWSPLSSPQSPHPSSPPSSLSSPSPSVSLLFTCVLFLLLCQVGVCRGGALKKGSSSGHDRPFSKCHLYFYCFHFCAFRTWVACRATTITVASMKVSVVSVVSYLGRLVRNESRPRSESIWPANKYI